MRIKANPRINPAGVSQANFQTQVVADTPNPLLSAVGNVAGLVAQQAPAFAQINQINNNINELKTKNDFRDRLKIEQQLYTDGLNRSALEANAYQKEMILEETENKIDSMWNESPYRNQFTEDILRNKESRKFSNKAYLMKSEQLEAISTAEMQMLDLSTSSVSLEEKIEQSNQIADGLIPFYSREKIELIKTQNKINLTVGQAKFIAETSIPQPQPEDVNGAEAYQTYRDQLIRGTKQVETFLKENGSDIPQEMRQKMVIQTQRRAATNSKQAENAYNLSFNNALKQRVNEITQVTEQSIGFKQLIGEGEPIPDQSTDNQEFATFWGNPGAEQYLDQIVKSETVSEMGKEAQRLQSIWRYESLITDNPRKLIERQDYVLKNLSGNVPIENINKLISTTQAYKTNTMNEVEKLTKPIFEGYKNAGLLKEVPPPDSMEEYIKDNKTVAGYDKWLMENYNDFATFLFMYDQALTNPAYANIKTNEEAQKMMSDVMTNFKKTQISKQDEASTNFKLKQERIDNWGNWEFGN